MSCRITAERTVVIIRPGTGGNLPKELLPNGNSLRHIPSGGPCDIASNKCFSKTMSFRFVPFVGACYGFSMFHSHLIGLFESSVLLQNRSKPPV